MTNARLWLFLLAIALLANRSQNICASEIQFGAASVKITPPEPIRLCGYSERRTPYDGVAAELRANAFAFGSDQEGASLLVMVELIGAPADIVEPLAGRLASKSKISRERIAVCATHTHTGPVLSAFLKGAHFPEPLSLEEMERLGRYEAWLIDQLEKVSLDALAARRPAQLAWTQGNVAFAANRRFIENGTYIGMKAYDGPVDHSLPVMIARDTSGQLLAVLVNYACHCTTYAPRFNQVHGDWAGAAMRMIEERHPETTAMVTIGCGADANPSPRGAIEGSSMVDAHGQAVADEVDRLLGLGNIPLHSAPTCRFKRVDLPFDHVPTREELLSRVEAGGRPSQYAQILLGRIERGESIPASFSYPVQAWNFGEDLAMVFLAGEVLVDYSLRLKRELDSRRLWVTAYANDTPGYIASKRVILEGGYEVDDSMNNYGKPMRLALDVEDRIIRAAKDLAPASFVAVPLRRMDWQLEGQNRAALVRIPIVDKQSSAPLVFVWHGYGGTMEAAAAKFAMHDLWPEAFVVYPQGAPTPRRIENEDVAKPGWQLQPGELNDRDLAFFDAMLATFQKEFPIDAERVFATGHSNGGRFTQILWAMRGDRLAAVAPSGTFVDGLFDRLKAKPCLHLAGEKDVKVPISRQLETIDAIHKLNGCDATGQPWGTSGIGKTMWYPSASDTPLVTFVHPGGHDFPTIGTALIINFFKRLTP